MIVAQCLNKRFGKIYALNNVSASCKMGECIALTGPNGSGKTTFIKSLLGIVKPDSGDIIFKGANIMGDSGYRNAIGYMPQIGRYPENMKIGEVFDMLKDIRRTSGKYLIDDDLVNSFGIKGLMDKRMGTLSGGTRQKVSAALAFLFNPEVLILDEPTAGLDPIAAEIFKEKVAFEKSRGKLIMITSHVLSELEGMVTEIIYMQDGSLLLHKKLEELQTETGEQKLARAIAVVMRTKLNYA